MTTRRTVAFVADTHIDETKRFDEHNEVMQWILLDAMGRRCSAMIHTGDVCERKSTARERAWLAEWVYGVTMRMPLIIVRGNHDDPLDIELLGRLQTGGHRCTVFTRPGWIDPLSAGGLVVFCLPWPNKAYLLRAKPELSGEAADREARLVLQATLRDFGNTYRQGPPDDTPRIFAGHVMVSGSRTSLSQPPLVGMDLKLGIADLEQVGAAFYGLGHIHMEQGWVTSDGAPVVYPGNPMRRNFGEVERKGYVVATFEGSKLVDWLFVPTPCAPMIHLTASWDDKKGLVPTGGPDPDCAGAEVRFRYDVPATMRAPAAIAARLVADKLKSIAGAKLVKIEERVLPVNRARVPDVARAPSLQDKLVTYWNSQGPTKGPTHAQRERLLALLATPLETR